VFNFGPGRRWCDGGGWPLVARFQSFKQEKKKWQLAVFGRTSPLGRRIPVRRDAGGWVIGARPHLGRRSGFVLSCCASWSTREGIIIVHGHPSASHLLPRPDWPQGVVRRPDVFTPSISALPKEPIFILEIVVRERRQSW